MGIVSLLILFPECIRGNNSAFLFYYILMDIHGFKLYSAIVQTHSKEK